jgi:hypothetical protein
MTYKLAIESVPGVVINPCSCLVGLTQSPGAPCVGGDDVLRFTCRFDSWKHHTMRLDPPVGLPPSTRGRSTAFNGQMRHRPISTIYDIYFQLAKLAAHRPGPRPRHPTTPHGDGRSSCRHLQTPGRLFQTNVIQKLEHQPKRASKEPSRQWVIGTQKERSDCSCAFTRLR